MHYSQTWGMGQCSGKLGGGGDDILETTAWIRRVVTGYQENMKQGQYLAGELFASTFLYYSTHIALLFKY